MNSPFTPRSIDALPPHASIPLNDKPLDKITYGTSAAAACVVAIWIARTTIKLDIPPEVEAALKTLAIALPVAINWLVNYRVPIKRRELKS
jgi:uncharacterized membrane-anchored protein